jgi:hypothetical protein
MSSHTSGTTTETTPGAQLFLIYLSLAQHSDTASALARFWLSFPRACLVVGQPFQAVVLTGWKAGAARGISKALPGRAKRPGFSARQPRARMTEQTFGMNSVVTIFRNYQK